MKYIDAEYVRAVMINDRLLQGNAEFNLYAQQVEIQVNAMPSIEIIRCKECKYYAEHNELYINAPTNCVKHSTINYYVVVNADDFCSCGEREDE